MPVPRRADSRRTREAILRVADEAFGEGDRPPRVEEIARLAGVARATVYRHFSHRFSLATAVARENLHVLVDATKGRDESFRALLELVLSTQASMRPLAHLMRDLPESTQHAFIRRILALLTPALHRAQARGEVNPELEADDLELILRMLESALDALPPGADREKKAQRVIGILLDGVSINK